MYSDETRSYFRGKRVLVTGGSGFIGSHVVEQLLTLDAHPVVPSRTGSSTYLASLGNSVELTHTDLRQRSPTINLMVGIDTVLHLAATVGGLAYNIGHSAEIFDANMRVDMNILHAATRAGVNRVLLCSSACVYPRHCTIPTPEEEGFEGVPDPTNAGYGWSKRMLEFLGATYADEHGLSVAIARPYNTYGPRDHFDPDRSHVIPALILKALEAVDNEFEVWGDGDASRAFIYVEDVAHGIIETAARHAVADAINIGSNEETPIATLAEMITTLVSQITGHTPTAVFRPDAPAGQPRRKCDTTKARLLLGLEARTPLIEGLARTIEWYLAE